MSKGKLIEKQFVKPSKLCNTTVELLSVAFRWQYRYFTIHYIFLRKDWCKKIQSLLYKINLDLQQLFPKNFRLLFWTNFLQGKANDDDLTFHQVL